MADEKRSKKGQFLKGTSGNPAGKPRSRIDGWASALTGIGSIGIDKRTSHNFQARRLTYQDVINLWEGDDLARRAIESVPKECFRNSYELVIADEGKYDDLKEQTMLLAANLQIDKLVKRAYCLEQAFGGAAILIGADDASDLSLPLNEERVKSLDWLTVLEPIELQPSSNYQDPTNPKYGEPEFYQLSSYANFANNGIPDVRTAPPNAHLIHESRLIIFPGLKVSRYQNNNNPAGVLWGTSALNAMVDVLRDFNIAWASAGLIVTDFAQSVISIENLMALVMKDPAALQNRMRAVELSRSTARAILIDTKESYTRQSTSVAGLPELLDRLSTRLAAAINMPLTLLMGQSPKGLGNEGDSDVRFYYDGIQGIQTEKIRPILMKLYGLAMRTIQKDLPNHWFIRFAPLWQLTDQEKADARLTQARSDSMYIKMGAVTAQEIRDSRFRGEYSFETQINESDPAPGIAMLPVGGTTSGGIMGETAPGAVPAGSASAPKDPNSHGVKGYVRKNPQKKQIVEAVKEGGDVPTGGSAEKLDDDTVEKHAGKWHVIMDDEFIAEFSTEEEADERLKRIQDAQDALAELLD